MDRGLLGSGDSVVDFSLDGSTNGVHGDGGIVDSGLAGMADSAVQQSPVVVGVNVDVVRHESLSQEGLGQSLELSHLGHGLVQRDLASFGSPSQRVGTHPVDELGNSLVGLFGAVLVVGIIVVFFDWVAGQAVSLLGELL